MTIDQIIQTSSAIKAWYWEHGLNRKGQWGLGLGTWLDKVHSLSRDAEIIHASDTDYKKPCLAVWGPSQSGKSTLLCDYIDGDGDGRGNGTALQWHPDDPAKFVGDIEGGNVTVLNPFNKGADASGCVTRFVLREEKDLADLRVPVEVIFATEGQIMHALAVGYLSETQHTTSDDQILKLDSDKLKELASETKVTGPPKTDAFELLVEIADTIELLIISKIGRYDNLKRDWELSLRKFILESEYLLCDLEHVRKFAQAVFWDSWPSINAAFTRLKRKKEEIAEQFGNCSVRCSLRVAALMVNISAAESYDRADSIQQTVSSCGFKTEGDVVKIGENFDRKLFKDGDDFALFQGLVWELVVPLRADTMRKREKSRDAVTLLETADLLDFPGVANEYTAADLLTDEKLAKTPNLILTKVLKRGKTASIVVTSSRNLNIDGFSLLMRMNRYPAHPVQLMAGIRTWWESLGKSWPPKSRELPLNLVLTFSAALINDCRYGVGLGLHSVFDKMKGLSHLADPKIVRTFPTNYPQFPDGKIQVEASKLPKTLAAISGDVSFRRQFGDTAEALTEMAENGGKDYLLRALTEQARDTGRPVLVLERRKRVIAEFETLLNDTLPGEADPGEQRRADIEVVTKTIKKLLKSREHGDPGIKAGKLIQKLVNVDPESLDSLPRQAKTRQSRNPIRPFLEKQFNDWRERKSQEADFEELGLRESSMIARLLTYLIDSVNMKELDKWFLRNLGNIRKRRETSESRRFLATRMNNDLLGPTGGSIGQSHPTREKIHESIRKLANAEFEGITLEESPYYLSIVQPFIKKLEVVKAMETSERGEQPGDAELSNIVNRQ